MYSILPTEPVQNAIINILAEKQSLEIEELQKELHKNKVSVSRANLYRFVKKMIQSLILVKVQKELRLNSIWMNNILQFSKKIQEDSQKQKTSFEIDLKEGEKTVFHGTSLQDLDVVWCHIMSVLGEQSPPENWYGYDAHPWYHIGMADTEITLYKTLYKNQHPVFILFGNNTFLDQYAASLINIEGYNTTLCQTQPPFPGDGYVAWSMGDYIIEVFFPEIIERHFSIFFKTITSIDQFDPQVFADIFKMKAPCKLTFRRNKKDAEVIRNQIKEFF